MITQYLTSATDIVREAGAQLKALIGSAKIQRIKARDDLVTDGDLLVEDIVLGFVERNYPDHGYDSEERGRLRADSEFVWVLDPIDGTKYYARGLPLYSISLALRRRERLILGVVYLPETDQTFSAVLGQGATLNGREIHCSPQERLEECYTCLEIPNKYSSTEERRRALSILDALIRRTQRVRILGVGSLGLCFCAMGGFDAYVNLGSSWKYCDHAAGRVILEEAGGKYVETEGMIVAGRPEITSQILDVLKGS